MKPLFAWLAILPLAGCGVVDATRTETGNEILLESTARYEDLGQLASLQSLHLSGRVTLRDEAEPIDFETFLVMPRRVLSRFVWKDAVYFSSSGIEGQRRWRSTNPKEPLAELGEEEPEDPRLFWSRVFSASGLIVPIWYRRWIEIGGEAEKISTAPEQKRVRIRFETSEDVVYSPVLRALAGSEWILSFDHLTDRLRRARLAIEHGGESHAAVVDFDHWSEFDGVVLPARSRLRLDGELYAECSVDDFARVGDAWPDWVLALVPSEAEFLFPERESMTKAADLMYQVQEEMFGTRGEKGDQPIYVDYDKLSTLFLKGRIPDGEVDSWVNEAGRFRIEERTAGGVRVHIFEGLELANEIRIDGVERDPGEDGTAAQWSWILRSLLIRPLVRESLNGAMQDDHLLIRTRVGTRTRQDVSLRVYLDAPRTPEEGDFDLLIRRVEAFHEESPEKSLALDLQYAERDIARFTITTPNGRVIPVEVVGKIDRGVKIPPQAFQAWDWKG